MSNQRLYRHTAARYGSMIVFANDTGAVTASLLKYGEWAEAEIAFMASLVGEGATILDVGAYIGTHTLAFSRIVGAQGQVIAFEPQPASFEILKKNVAFNRLLNVVLHNAGVGAVSGESDFLPLDPAASTSFGSAALGDQEPNPLFEVARVQTVTVDGLGLDRCDLIKIDVEGMEHSVIEGAWNTIQRHHPWIYAECNSVEGGLSTWKVLKKLGYDVRLHLVKAFNPQNFRGEMQSIFADAREVALVGVPSGGTDRLPREPIGYEGMLLTLETADDLVLGMLNKPQYVDEILRSSSAAVTGGDLWIHGGANGNSAQGREIDRLSTQLAHTEDVFGSVQALAIERAAEIERLSGQLAETQSALERTQMLAVERAAESDRISDQLARTQEGLETTQALAIERATEAKRLSGQIARTQEALEVTQRLAVERFQQIGQLEAMVGATLRQADLARSRYREEIAALEGMRHRSDEAQQDAERLTATLASIEADHGRCKEQVAALLRSTSWRITRPVRVISRALRRR